MSQRIEQLNSKIAKFNELLKNLALADSHVNFVTHDEEFWPLGQCVQSHVLAQDGLHLSKRGVVTLAKTLLSKVEVFQLSVRSERAQACTPDEPQNPDSSEQAPSVGSDSQDEEFPPTTPSCLCRRCRLTLRCQ